MDPIRVQAWPPAANQARRLLAAVIARTDFDDLMIAQVLLIASTLEAQQPIPSPVRTEPASASVREDLDRVIDLLTAAAFESPSLHDSLFFATVARDVSDVSAQLDPGPAGS